MNSAQTRLPLWAGRAVAFLGIVLIAANMRIAVTGISPITTQIAEDVPLSSVTLGLIGALPPIAFALMGLTAGRIARRIGLERFQLISIAVMIVGHLVRSLAPGVGFLILGTLLALLACGVTNVLLPPLVKRYFPDRIGLMTSLYAFIMAIGATLPALLAAPVADAAGWRVSLATWAALAATAAVPWLILILRERREKAAALAADEIQLIGVPEHPLAAPIWRSPLAWKLAAVVSVTSFNTYVLFAWLPEIARQQAGSSAVEAGIMLSIFAVIGAPVALVSPLIVTRMRTVSWYLLLGVALFVTGYLGLLIAPSPLTWLWACLVGIAPLLFPASLTLVNLRTRGHDGSVALSAFSQGVGYAVGAIGPFAIGIVHDATGGWTVPLIVLIVVALLGVIPAVGLARPSFLEDELRDRAR
jgi:CP family cyanate transporter-like MFS transporter